MNINTAFPSKYLKAADLQGGRRTVTISEVTFEDIGDGEKKPVVFFEGKKAGLVLNRTNANAIIEITGSAETSEWEGASIVLYPTKVDFQGKRVDAIRVDAPTGQARVINATRPPKRRDPEPPAWTDEPIPADAQPAGDDDIPF